MEVIRAVIEIGPEATSLLVAATEEGRVTTLLERRQELVATRLGARALASVVEAEAAIARDEGAESVLVMAEPQLRGSHLMRGLSRRLEADGLGGMIAPTAVERGTLTFRGATSVLADSRAGDVAVVEIGRNTTAIAVGDPASRPRWWSARPLHADRLLKTALRGDPPLPGQDTVALELARRQLGNLKPPPARQALLFGPDASLAALACGTEIDATSCAEARLHFGGHLSEIIAAELGVEPRAGRRLPAALVIVQAVCELLDCPVRVAHCGPAEGLLLSELEGVGTGGSAHT